MSNSCPHFRPVGRPCSQCPDKRAVAPPRPGAPKGSANAQKYDEPATATIQIRVPPSLKRMAQASAKGRGMSLSEWVILLLERNL